MRRGTDGSNPVPSSGESVSGAAAHPDRADPLLYQSEVEPGAAADLHDGRAAPQLQRCNGATPVCPPPEADQVIGIHRPVVEARPAAVDFVDLLGRRKVAPAQGWISLALGTRQRPCGEVPLKLLDTLYDLLAFHREGQRSQRDG